MYAFCSCSSRAVLASSPGYVADVSSRDVPSDRRAFSSCAANANASKANALVPTADRCGTGARFLLETPTCAPGVKAASARGSTRGSEVRGTPRGARRERATRTRTCPCSSARGYEQFRPRRLTQYPRGSRSQFFESRSRPAMLPASQQYARRSARGLVARTLHSRAASSRANPPFAKRLTGRNSMATAAWDGSGTQEDLMYRDECILVVRPAPRPSAQHPREQNLSAAPIDALTHPAIVDIIAG